MAITTGPVPAAVQPDPLDDLDVLYRAYNERLVRLCRRHLGPNGDPEDAAHEALLKAWAGQERFDRSRPLWPWLATIARNTCVDQQRHRGMSRSRVLPTEGAQVGPEDLVMGGAHRRLVQEAINELSPQAREVLVLRDVRELEYGEIALRQRRSEAAIRKAVARARRDLRVRIEALARSRGTWPLAAFTGGVTPRPPRLLHRWRAAMHRRSAQVSLSVDQGLAQVTPWVPSAVNHVILASSLVVAAWIHHDVAADASPRQVTPSLVEGPSLVEAPTPVEHRSPTGAAVPAEGPAQPDGPALDTTPLPEVPSAEMPVVRVPAAEVPTAEVPAAEVPVVVVPPVLPGTDDTAALGEALAGTTEARVPAAHGLELMDPVHAVGDTVDPLLPLSP